MKRFEEEKIIMDCDNFINLMNQAKEGTYSQDDEYMNLFRKIANSHGVHFSDNVVKDLKY